MKRAPPGPPEHTEVFTFGYPMVDRLVREPRVLNGEVSVRRYRVVVELIDESIEVIHQRLIDLWATSDNMHHAEPLRARGRQVRARRAHLRCIARIAAPGQAQAR